MSGSKKTPRLTRKAILLGMKTPPPGGYFLWDGKNQDDRPLTAAEMDAGIAAYRVKRGRPAGSKKVSTTIRFDTDVVAKFRARGRGWQSQMNAALREWLQAHE